MIVPVRDVDGRIVALKVRRDDADIAAAKEAGRPDAKYVYLSSKKCGGPGPGSPVHVPAGITRPVDLARMTEGELKADVATTRSGVPTISMPGVGSWRAALEAARKLETKTIRLAFDADAVGNPHVAKPLRDCSEAIITAGLILQLERWPAELGKGIDDVLASGHGDRIEVLIGDAALTAAREIARGAGVPEGDKAILAELLDFVREHGSAALLRDKSKLEVLARVARDDPGEFHAMRSDLQDVGVKMLGLNAALKPIRERLRRERFSANPQGAARGGYAFHEGAIVRISQGENSESIIPLADFVAKITDETIHDDGAEQQFVLGIEGQLGSGRELPRIEVTAEEFAWPDWVVAKWGADAIVWLAGRRELGPAIQALSGEKTRRVVYGHTGWREVAGRWLYLHGGGGIGEDGNDSTITVELPPSLAPFNLSGDDSHIDIKAAITASLRLLDTGPGRITFPLVAAIFRAVITPADFGLFLAGPTGCFKSEIAALAQRHFGCDFTARHLPASWSSTANSLEVLAFTAKDALLVVDDFAPHGSSADVSRFHRDADRLFRGQGNHSGRQRLRPDGTLRHEKPPRGLILATGEDIPVGQSLRARLFVVEMSRGDIPADRLTAAQHDGDAGLYAHTMVMFLQWLAPDYAERRTAFRNEVTCCRDELSADGHHARTPGIVADLEVAFEWLLLFANEFGAIDAARQAQLRDRCHRALLETADAQLSHQEASEPAQQFIRLLSALIVSGRAYVAGIDGKTPAESATTWGWRHPTDEASSWQPQGRLIGWLDGDDLLIEPDAAFAEAKRLSDEQGHSLAVTQSTLWKRLHERGLLASRDESRERLKVRRVIGDARRDVLHLRASLITKNTVPTVPPTPNPHADTVFQGAGSPTPTVPTVPNGTVSESGRPTAKPTATQENDDVGQLGQFSNRRDTPPSESESEVGEWSG